MIEETETRYYTIEGDEITGVVSLVDNSIEALRHGYEVKNHASKCAAIIREVPVNIPKGTHLNKIIELNNKII